MKKEDIEEILRPKYHHTSEDIDAEEVYYDNNRSAIRSAIEEGRIDPEILTEDILANFISDGIDYTVYDEIVKKYCIDNNFDYEEYKAGRERIIEENIEKKSKETAEKTERWNKVKEIEKALKSEYGYEYIEDLRNEFKSSEDYYDHLIEVYGDDYLSIDEVENDSYDIDENNEVIKELLKPRYVDSEDIDEEEVYYNNNRSAIRSAIEEGRIDPEILTEEIIANFISDGIDYTIYDEMVKKYCIENNIDYEEYKAGRERIIEEKVEKKSKETAEKTERWNKVKEIEKALKSEYGYEYIENLRHEFESTEDYYDHLIETYGEDYLSIGETEDDYELDEDEIKNFMENAANESELPENVSIKNNWINKIKEWFKDKINTIKNTFQR